MNLFFQIQSLQLLIFCMGHQEFVTNLDYFFYVFFCNIIKVNHFFVLFYYIVTLNHFFTPNRSLLILYAYVSIESNDCIFLSSFELNAIILISSVKTLCISLLNLFCVFNIDLLFIMNSL